MKTPKMLKVETCLRATMFLAFASLGGNVLARQNPATSSTITTIWSFTGANGEYPLTPPIFDSSGAAYGSTGLGGTGLAGTVFRLTPPTAGGAWTEAVLYSFEGGSDGQQPNDVVFGPSGTLYSATDFGGSDLCYMGCGTIFELTPPAEGDAWTHTLLYEF